MVKKEPTLVADDGVGALVVITVGETGAPGVGGSGVTDMTGDTGGSTGTVGTGAEVGGNVPLPL